MKLSLTVLSAVKTRFSQPRLIHACVRACVCLRRRELLFLVVDPCSSVVISPFSVIIRLFFPLL